MPAKQFSNMWYSSLFLNHPLWCQPNSSPTGDIAASICNHPLWCQPNSSPTGHIAASFCNHPLWWQPYNSPTGEQTFYSQDVFLSSILCHAMKNVTDLHSMLMQTYYLLTTTICGKFRFNSTSKVLKPAFLIGQ